MARGHSPGKNGAPPRDRPRNGGETATRRAILRFGGVKSSVWKKLRFQNKTVFFRLETI
jgi:hypothetical protein